MAAKQISSLVFAGGAIGLETLTGLKFTTHRPHTYCRICGEVFQSDFDRTPEEFISRMLPTVYDVDLYAEYVRKNWSQRHSKLHPQREHESLVLSKRWCTPEAALKLAAFGIISVIDLAIDDEVQSAYAESSPVPTNDAQD